VNDQEVFALLLALAVLAQFIAVRFGMTAAIIEIVLGVVVANLLDLELSSYEWLVFMASLAGVLLTFLAGSEIDRDTLKGSWKTSASIGAVSFLAPFLAIFTLCYFGLGWSSDPSFLAATALSETSIAIVYVVLVDGGKSGTPLGSMLLSACFFTNLFASIALTVIFSEPSFEMVLLIAGLACVWFLAPKAMDIMERTFRNRPGEAAIKALLLVLAILIALSTLAGVAAVLGAYIAGLALARFMKARKKEAKEMKIVATAFLSSFFFIAAGAHVDVSFLAGGLIVVLFLTLVRLAAKISGVAIASKMMKVKEVGFSSMLMATSLTFGMVFCQTGLSQGLIDTEQFSLLVMVLILSAVVPTIIAQRVFDPWR